MGWGQAQGGDACGVAGRRQSAGPSSRPPSASGCIFEAPPPLQHPTLPCLVPPPRRPHAAAPTFLRCVISSKKCGVKAYGDSAPRFEQCSIEKCGEQGVRAMERAAPLLLG